MEDAFGMFRSVKMHQNTEKRVANRWPPVNVLGVQSSMGKVSLVGEAVGITEGVRAASRSERTTPEGELLE